MSAVQEVTLRLPDALQEQVDRFFQWGKAYPVDVFPEPDFKKARAALEAAGISLDSVSASNMRHVITRVCEGLRAAGCRSSEELP